MVSMVAPVLAVVGCVLVAVGPSLGGYMVTAPRQWVAGGEAQVCVVVDDPAAPVGSLRLIFGHNSDIFSISSISGEAVVEKPNVVATISVPEGKSEACHDVQVPNTKDYSTQLHVEGSVAGLKVNHSATLNFKRSNSRTFIQTDKFLYKPGELVQFRVLTVTGPELTVSTDQYPEVWVTNPSRTRIAQWRDVDNSGGIIHLDFRLADEPEKGSYNVHVRRGPSDTTTQTFEVREFVLPRYEVTLTPPPFILPIDPSVTFTVCANYTFGQPVKGNLSLTITNGQRKKCRATITRNVTISGCTEVEVSGEDLNLIDCQVYEVRAKAVVEEAGTDVSISKSSNTYVSNSAVSFNTEYKDEYMKPNLPYTLKVKAELPDGSAASGVPVEVCASGQCQNMTTPANAILTIVLPSYKSSSVLIKALNCRAALHSSEFTDTISHYYSPSNSSLLIHAPEDKLSCVRDQTSQHTLPVFFSARDQPSADITVQVISRGRIQYSQTQQYQLGEGPLPIDTESLVGPLQPPLPGTVRGVININLSLPPTASPIAKVLVWYVREDGEVVSDTRELEVEKCLPHDVSLSWSAEQAQPGDSATLTLTSEPESVCSLGVVDKSSTLLSDNPDPITLKAFFDFADGFQVSRWTASQINDYKYCKKQQESQKLAASDIIIRPRRRFYTEYSDALQMFNDAGVFVFTNHHVETRPCEADEEQPFAAFGGGFAGGLDRPMPAAPPSPAIASFTPLEDEKSPSPSPSQAPRTNFPETWLWDIVVVPASGVSEQAVTVPDTITQWLGKAVCAHPQKGFGLSPIQPITTFTPFFVDLTLPPTVKRGEVLPVKMSVFNYLDQPLPVSLALEESAEYEILEEAGSAGQRGKRSACVPAHDKMVLTVKIRPMEIGDVNISVSAAADQQSQPACAADQTLPEKRDALIKPIKIEAEGFLRENTWTKYICTKDFETGEDSLETWDLKLPATLVEGSARGWVTAVGDLLALSLENLGHLIRMPYGCGEQNMVNFAPNIFILQYLEASNQTTPEARTKLLNFMKTGYQRELLYRRSDGSYSAFGNADDSGSTWLTAFVLKSFAQAHDFIQVDSDSQKETSAWLLKQQEPDGCFKSVGKLLHKGMQGGVSSSSTPVPLTAYVMAALLEAGEDPASPPVAEAAKCLTADSSLHPYTLALKAYALVLARLPEAEAALQQLLGLAVVTKNSTYWELPKGTGSSRAVALETAGYAILAMMTHDPETMEPQARKVVKWITSQRNGQGGFYSTQDTVVALQALAVYESHLHQGPLNVEATVTATNFSHVFTVTDENKLLEQLKPLPSMPTSVAITMTGQGCAVLQAVQRYNIPEPEGSDAFDLTVNTITSPDNLCVTKRITACASYRLPDSESNMAVIEVDLTSGYIPEKEDLKQLLKDDRNIKRYEVDGSKVNFYINELTASDTCVNFRIIRVVDVEEVKPGTVVVYDYYQPEFSISKRYTLPSPDECR